MATDKQIQLAVLIASTGTASTLRSLVEAITNGYLKARIRLVISNMRSAPGVTVAKERGILTWVHSLLKKNRTEEKSHAHSESLARQMNNNSVDVAVLAGWPIILTKRYFELFQGVTINIHPGWIPDHPDLPVYFPNGKEALWNKGMMTDAAVQNFLTNTCGYAGSTIHIATPETDFGLVLERVLVAIQPEDTADSLYKRLKVAEQEGLISVLNTIQRIGYTIRHATTGTPANTAYS